jgi:hypothetical protein
LFRLGSFSLSLPLHHRLIAANQSVLFGATASFVDNKTHAANAAFVSWAFLGLNTYLFFLAFLATFFFGFALFFAAI